MPILLPSADANIQVPDPSSTLMGVLPVGLRGFCLTLTPENACRFPDAVSVAEPPCRRRWRSRFANSRSNRKTPHMMPLVSGLRDPFFNARVRQQPHDGNDNVADSGNPRLRKR